MSKEIISIGIDPGWKNLGLAISRRISSTKIEVIGSKVFNPSLGDAIFVESLPLIVNSILGDTTKYEVGYLTIERYVPYNNVFSAETENITMLIGMIRSRFFHSNECSESGLNVNLVRAIDWKIKLAQHNAKHTEFSNPSSSLDKKYSIAMASFITDNKYEFKTDHEADAICLSSLPLLGGQGPQARRLS